MIEVSQKQIFSFSFDNNSFLVRINEEELHSDAWNTANHCNAEYELHLITEGFCTVKVAGKILGLSSGDVLLIAPNTYHSCQSSDQQCKHFSANIIIKSKAIITEIAHSFRDFSFWHDDGSIMRACQCYCNECSHSDLFFYEMKQSFVSQILLYMLRKLHIRNSERVPLPKTQENHIDIMDQFFEQYYSESAGETKLALELGISTRQLARELQSYYGMTYRELIIKARLEQAKSLLKNTNTPIGIICRKLGYSTEASFYNMFKKQTGISPQQYRLNEE